MEYGLTNAEQRSSTSTRTEVTPNNMVEGGQPFLLEGGQIGVLPSHGFTGTSSGMWPLSEHLNREEGWAVDAPRLPGYGNTPTAMALTPAEDGIRTLEQSLELLQARCTHVLLADLSMGDCLTLHIAAAYPSAFRAIALGNA
jgi:carboxylesterase